MNDRDKTDVWSTSGVILIIFKSFFYKSLFCFCFAIYRLWVDGNMREGRGGKLAKRHFDLCLNVFGQTKEVLVRLRLVH